MSVTLMRCTLMRSTACVPSDYYSTLLYSYSILTVQMWGAKKNRFSTCFYFSPQNQICKLYAVPRSRWVPYSSSMSFFSSVNESFVQLLCEWHCLILSLITTGLPQVSGRWRRLECIVYNLDLDCGSLSISEYT